MKTHLFILLIFSQLCLAQKPKPFVTCNKTINYTADDLDLRKKAGLNLAFPVTNPTFTGGTEMLKKYFWTKPLNHSSTFRILIGFVVNCKGQAGNFETLVYAEADFRSQILEIAKKMPQKWKPATSKEGKPVDSYQVISLTIVEGRVRDINYK